MWHGSTLEIYLSLAGQQLSWHDRLSNTGNALHSGDKDSEKSRRH